MRRTFAQECPLASSLATLLRDARDEVTQRWLQRISARVALDANEVFPTAELLDHVPLLISGIADYLEEPSAEISTDTPVVGKAMELGALRHAQGFDTYEILKEYEILGGIIFTFLGDAVDGIAEPCAKSDLMTCGQRLFRAIAIIQQTTTTHFMRLMQEQVKEREERIRTFNRAVSHEIKNRIGTVRGAADILHEIPDMPADQRAKFVEIIRRNTGAMQAAVTNVLAVSRTASDPRQQRNVHLAEAVQEATRQVREAAQAAGVEIRISSELPLAEVNAAAVELCLTNYLSNAIKYSDRAQPERWVEIQATVEEMDGEREIVIRTRDNGLGVPLSKRDQLFQRFFRAHETVTEAEGTGLGLSIVQDAAQSLGGRAWAEFPEKGSVFAFSLPERRGSDRRVVGDPAGTERG